MVEFTRDEVVTLAQAVEEFRDEFSGPHIDSNRELAGRIRRALREVGGDHFALGPADRADEGTGAE